MPTTYPPSKAVERKVKAATAGAGVGAVLAELISWFLDDYIITPKVTGDLPGPVGGFLLVAVPAALALAGGFVAKHTARPDLPMSQR